MPFAVPAKIFRQLNTGWNGSGKQYRAGLIDFAISNGGTVLRKRFGMDVITIFGNLVICVFAVLA